MIMHDFKKTVTPKTTNPATDSLIVQAATITTLSVVLAALIFFGATA